MISKLSEDAVKEFQTLYKLKFGSEISAQQAERDLLSLMALLSGKLAS